MDFANLLLFFGRGVLGITELKEFGDRGFVENCGQRDHQGLGY